MRVKTLKRAAGRIVFGPDEELDLPDDQALELMKCEAVVSLEKATPLQKHRSKNKIRPKIQGE